MIELRFKGMTQNIPAIPGQITNVIIESPPMFYRLAKALYLRDDEQILVFKDLDPLPSSKEVFFIETLFDLNPNSKKVLTSIYKQASTAYMNEERNRVLSHIQAEVVELLDDISGDFNHPMVYEHNFGIDKIMQLSSFSFYTDETTDFLGDFLSYLKAIQEIMKCHFVVTLDLFSFLEDAQVDNLQKELSLLSLTLINLSSHQQKNEESQTNTILIDCDCCEI